MLDGVSLPEILDAGRIAGGSGLFIYFVYMLLQRHDSLQRENMEELRNQRDHYRERAERAEATLDTLRKDPS